MNRSHPTATSGGHDGRIKIGGGRTLVTVRPPAGDGFVMLTQQSGDGRLQIDANKVFRFPAHRPPDWLDAATAQLILSYLGVTG